MDAPSFHIAMCPWLAIGHITPYLNFSNKLAERGHKISFLIPSRTQSRFEHLNLHPHLITFIPITIPHVEGLPQGTETTSSLDRSLVPLLMTAMDRTKPQIEYHLLQLKPNFVFFDFAYWLPNLARPLGIKSVAYWVVSLVAVAYADSTTTQDRENRSKFPDSSIKLHRREEQTLARLKEREYGGIRFFDRISFGMRFSDVIAFKSCRELEGPFADYEETVYEKPILLSGPGIPETPSSTLEPQWSHWLGGFNASSVIYCSFGSECVFQLNQFQELLLGLELTGMPFLAAVKPPNGFQSVEAAMPEGFEERVKGRGIVHGGWVQQQLILEHPSVGCFITHCGFGSMMEALLSQSQLVLLPNILDQILNARMLGSSFKVGVEVQKEDDGLFTKDSVCQAVRSVMDDENEVAREVKANHAKLRTLLLSENLESNYLDNFCHKLQEVLAT